MSWIKKSLNRPILTVEPIISSLIPKSSNENFRTILQNKSKVHLVGVSHGSAASAELVKSTIASINPKAVVLELCNDRYFSISLESEITPNTNNQTLVDQYIYKLQLLKNQQEKESSSPTFSKSPLVSNAIGYYNLLKAHGLIVGIFISLGLLVTNLQKLIRPANMDVINISNNNNNNNINSNRKFIGRNDEFVTAMLSAEELNIPIRLGDAPQSDTLNSIKSIISIDTFNPSMIISGAQSLAFSAFGIINRNALNVKKDLLESSEWVNIPYTYLQDKSMLKSLTPLLVLCLLTSSIGLIPSLALNNVNANDVTDLSAIATTASSFSLSPVDHHEVVNSFLSWIMNILNTELSPQIELFVDSFIDLMSVLLLIRLSKIIGEDRDRIIASKIKQVCEEFPGEEIVVVIGMLHCNGVARWLLSDKDSMENTNTIQQII
eukprot:gene9989-13441_t